MNKRMNLTAQKQNLELKVEPKTPNVIYSQHDSSPAKIGTGSAFESPMELNEQFKPLETFESDSMKGKDPADIGLDDIIKKIYAMKADLGGRITFCCQKVGSIPGFEQRLTKMTKGLMNCEQKSDYDKKQSDERCDTL